MTSTHTPDITVRDARIAGAAFIATAAVIGLFFPPMLGVAAVITATWLAAAYRNRHRRRYARLLAAMDPLEAYLLALHERGRR